MWSRRTFLAAGVSGLATAVAAEAPLTSLRPVARADRPARSPQTRSSTRELIAQANIGGVVGWSIVDVSTGEVLDQVDAGVAVPPASVTKAITALYALDAMGPAHRFTTRVIARGAISDQGILDGDLILAGGGDPVMDTDDLAELARRLKDTGLTEVRGDFLVWGGAIQGVEEIDTDQLDHFGYNPSISGLNLNFNRVHFEWKRAATGFDITMDARSENFRPEVNVAQMQVVDRASPVFAYRDAGDIDAWSVARGALNDAGSRWLPVRVPALYAGEVFAIFARAHGIQLKPAKRAAQTPQGLTLATLDSPPLAELMREMMKYSTNLTAEIAGLAASQVRAGAPRGLRTSALGMSRWLKDTAGIDSAFVDHSGLGDASRISAGGMTSLLARPGVLDQLRPIMKQIVMLDDKGRAVDQFPGEVRAKTGTLNFVTTLAGYIRTSSGRNLAFAIFAADLVARERGKAAAEERPAGALTFNRRAKRLQQTLLQRWALI